MNAKQVDKVLEKNIQSLLVDRRDNEGSHKNGSSHNVEVKKKLHARHDLYFDVNGNSNNDDIDDNNEVDVSYDIDSNNDDKVPGVSKTTFLVFFPTHESTKAATPRVSSLTVS